MSPGFSQVIVNNQLLPELCVNTLNLGCLIVAPIPVNRSYLKLYFSLCSQNPLPHAFHRFENSCSCVYYCENLFLVCFFKVLPPSHQAQAESWLRFKSIKVTWWGMVRVDVRTGFFLPVNCLKQLFCFVFTRS